VGLHENLFGPKLYFPSIVEVFAILEKNLNEQIWGIMAFTEHIILYLFYFFYCYPVAWHLLEKYQLPLAAHRYAFLSAFHGIYLLFGHRQSYAQKLLPKHQGRFLTNN